MSNVSMRLILFNILTRVTDTLPENQRMFSIYVVKYLLEGNMFGTDLEMISIFCFI